jgi:hypothetical protein
MIDCSAMRIRRWHPISLWEAKADSESRMGRCRYRERIRRVCYSKKLLGTRPDANDEIGKCRFSETSERLLGEDMVRQRLLDDHESKFLPGPHPSDI